MIAEIFNFDDSVKNQINAPGFDSKKFENCEFESVSAQNGVDGQFYTFFYRSKNVFSNFYPSFFVAHGILFNCSEQYFMYQKARYFNDLEIAAEILQNSDPATIKSLGRKVKNFDVKKWDKVSISIMKTANYYKFVQNPTLRAELFKTKGSTLAEASPRDTIWGIGFGMANNNILDPKKWRGKNQLGFILTKLRDYLMEKPEFKHEC
uniref:NADAR domain-containing protein n=1 Tax=Panagrolaimus sp. JU765 TaxID=591449 RepID=A0AC34R4Y8_9BILA